jgi:tRNA U34 5-methylaminomethyl-2-thiouridine-forming methyltransferase MnmC
LARYSIEETEDGSVTVYDKDAGATFHSRHGAITESKHIFIETGLDFVVPMLGKKLNVLEVGFGSGLNVLLTAIAAQKNQLEISYTAIECYPLPESVYSALNYAEVEADASFFQNLHLAGWGSSVGIFPGFELFKHHGDVNAFPFLMSPLYHLVYFDAFGPADAPEMWSVGLFEKIFESMNSEACLVTFSSKGEVKRMLKSAGFIVETLPGPPGKREITRAVKK